MWAIFVEYYILLTMFRKRDPDVRQKKEILSAPSIKPLGVIENFPFSENKNQFPAPFASEEEYFGLLSGSESSTLCSMGETLVSKAFVQCAGALAKNMDTGLITLIHESMWSSSATGALALQKKHNLQFITMDGASGYMKPENIAWAHKGANERDNLSNIEETFHVVSREASTYKPYDEKIERPFIQAFGDSSRIKGLSQNEIHRFLKEMQNNQIPDGTTKFLGRLALPVSKKESGRWYLTYRPTENFIYIFESGVEKLFVYPGFPD